MPSRFVILQHTVADGEHWDFMLEQGDVLLTWRLGREPIDVSTLPIVAHRIADHHKTFLEFEGRLSRDQGHVRRIDRGRADIEEITESRIVARLEDGRLSGRVTLRADGNDWVLEPG